MRKTVKVCTAIWALILSAVFLCGAVRFADIKYFSVYYDTRCVTVTEKMLHGNWYHQDSRSDFIAGRDLYTRAEQAETAGKSACERMERLPEIMHIIRKLEREIRIPAYDGHINFNPSGAQKFWVSGAKSGRILDTEALCAQILRTLKTRKYSDIEAPIKQIEPCGEQELLKNIALRSSYTTRFIGSGAGRVNNIKTALASFNGVIVQPGENISFNRTVGARTRERGYEEANIIVDGEFIPGVGGGVCQVSTTVFNAALLSGLDIIESHNHSLAIGYVPLGRDAMVTSAADLVFKNNTGAPVYIEAFASNSTAAVKFYGRPACGITYKPQTSIKTSNLKEEVEGTVPADLISNPALYEKVAVERGIPAREVLTYMEIYKGGRLIHRKPIRKSRYKGKPKIVRWEKKPEQPNPAPLNDMTMFSI